MTIKQQVLDFITDNPNLTKTQIAHRTGIAADSVRGALRVLVAQEYVTKEHHPSKRHPASGINKYKAIRRGNGN